MELKDLKPAAGSRKNRKRVGRGPASGHGKTAGTIFKSVVFPQPECPRIETNSFARKLILTPFNACTFESPSP